MSQLPKTGADAPPFTIRDTANRTHTLVDANAPSALTLLFFFKHDCPTCDLVAPAIERINQGLSGAGLRVLGISQHDAEETAAFAQRHALTMPLGLDVDLEVSALYGFDAVPALVLTGPDERVVTSVEGFVKAELLALARAAAEHYGADTPDIEDPSAPLPNWRPGCGSRAHEPDVARRLAVKRGAGTLVARRVRVPTNDDPYEFLTDQGLTDGLPVIPPTEERVLHMLDGTSRAATDVVARVPPNLAPATVEKIAINAVMAGCRPRYLPVVLAAVEAACTDAFNLHGVLATTYCVGPIIIINGPIRHEIGINCKGNVFGQGFRANATIGRALQLVVRNVGGGRPAEVDMATLGQPGKFGCCIGENEEASHWDPLHVERGFDCTRNTVTLFAGEAPRAIRDHLSRRARSLATSIGFSMESVAHVKQHGLSETLLVVCPEHAQTFKKDGYSKSDLRARIQETTARPLRDIVPTDACEEGTLPKAIQAKWFDSNGQPTAEAWSRPVPKFKRAEDILIVVAGGSAGKHSAVVGGWAAGAVGSIAVTREILHRAR